MAGPPPVGRRARTTRTTPSNYVRTTLLFGTHSSCRLLVPPVGRRTRTTQTTSSEYVRTTLLFGAHSSPWVLVASVHRQPVIDHSAVELREPHPSDLFAPHAAKTLHSTSPRVASTSPKIGHRLVQFLRFGALRRTGRGSISPAADTVFASVFAIPIEGGSGSAEALAAATPSAQPTYLSRSSTQEATPAATTGSTVSVSALLGVSAPPSSTTRRRIATATCNAPPL